MDDFKWEDLDKDGLTFLMEHRKEVFIDYQKLVNNLGQNLDEKTRQLIMLAIQVNSPAPEAIKIIIPKAIRSGATKNEIIDTLLMTIPVVGLSTVLKMLTIVLKELATYGRAYEDVTK